VIGTDGSSCTWCNQRVDKYGSRFGLRRSYGLGFWTGPELNWPVFAVQTWPALRLPKPVAHTKLRVCACMLSATYTRFALLLILMWTYWTCCTINRYYSHCLERIGIRICIVLLAGNLLEWRHDWNMSFPVFCYQLKSFWDILIGGITLTT